MFIMFDARMSAPIATAARLAATGLKYTCHAASARSHAPDPVMLQVVLRHAACLDCDVDSLSSGNTGAEPQATPR